VVISASPTQARDTVEPIKHRLVFLSDKQFISFLTISFFFILFPIQMETICLMGSTVSRACVGLAEITTRPIKRNHPKTST
jgi:hypothetical protein